MRDRSRGDDSREKTGNNTEDEQVDIEEEPEVEILDQPEASDELESELIKKNEELTDALLRLKADFENYRKRMIKEQTRILETAEANLISKLLPALDNLERALDNADPNESPGLREGVEMVLGQIMETLQKEGLEVIDPHGEPFDPEHHEAMMVVETEECPEDTVVEVVQKGYRFGGVLLRPAMVKVSCAVKK